MFRAEVEQLEDRLIVRLSEGASQALPSRGQVAVTGTVDGQEIATVIEPDGRRGHWIAVDRLGLDLAAGVWVTLELTPTRQWPEPEVPVDLSTALAEASGRGADLVGHHPDGPLGVGPLDLGHQE